MNHLHVKYLLVGGGLASASAAAAIRERDPEGSVLLVAQEHTRPYHRSPLSKSFLRREIPREQLFAVGPDWFERNRVALRTARRVSRIDTARTCVTLDNAEEISFDRLLLATGASPLPLEVPGASLPNVHYLRTLDDEERLRNTIEKAKREGRPHTVGGSSAGGRGVAAIVGGGLLGVELAGSLTRLGLAVELVTEAHPWSRFAGEGTGKFLARYLEKHGVRVHADTRPLRLEGDGRVQRVALDSGQTVACDFLIAAVGAAANKDVLRGTSIAAGRAILTDERCRTNVPGIYAAGDCAALLDPRFGKHRWMDDWATAVATGALAGRNMAGGDEAYTAVNYYDSEVFDLGAWVWGDAKRVDRRILRGIPTIESPNFVEIGVAADGRVVQVLRVGNRTDVFDPEPLKQLVARRVSVEGLEERLKDPAVPLSGLLGD